MSFNSGYSFVVEYLETRQHAMLNVQRLPWSTQPLEDLAALNRKFSSSKENTEWEQMYEDPEKRVIDQIVATRNKIAWLCAARRDLRKQFAAADSDRVRTSLDQMRYELQRIKWALDGLVRFNELLAQRD